MKNLLLSLLFFATFQASGQAWRDVKPSDTDSMKYIQSPIFHDYLTRHTIWLYKGSQSGYTELATYKNLRSAIDSIGSGRTIMGVSPIAYNSSTGEISIPAATNTNAGAATAAHIQAIEANTLKISFPGFGTNHTTAAYGDHNHTGSYLTAETDPVFNAWNKKTGISITKSQVSDFPTQLSQFTNNLGNYGSFLVVSDISGKKDKSDSTAIDGYTRRDRLTTELAKKISFPGFGNNHTTAAYGDHTHAETDPIFSAWDKKTGISITKSQVSDFPTQLSQFTNNLGNYGSFLVSSDKGSNNGVATLDAGGKVPMAQLPASLFINKGTWDAETNYPYLVNGVGVNGWVYQSTSDGVANFGAGDLGFFAGDYVIYNGSIWQWSPGSNSVKSINGQQGIVTLTTTNIAEGSNKYYTDARVSANSSVVANTAKVSFPGFGTNHTTAAYGDHNHTGVYQPAGSYLVASDISGKKDKSDSTAIDGYTRRDRLATELAKYLPLTGGALSGSVSYNTTAIGNVWKIGGLNRWIMRNDGAETGSNAGSNFNIYRYDDAGNPMSQPLSINRATGLWTIGGALTSTGIITATGTGANSTNWTAAYNWGNWASNFGTTAGTIAQGNHNHTGVYQPAGSYLTAETDPIFTVWDKKTGISITKSQVSDFPAYGTTAGTITQGNDSRFTNIAYTNQSNGFSGFQSINGSTFPIFEALRLSNVFNESIDRGISQTFYIPHLSASSMLGGEIVVADEGAYGAGNSYMAFWTSNAGTIAEKLRIAGNGNLTAVGAVTATQFIKSGGTSTQFLKADGSVDASSYLTSLTGAILVGDTATMLSHYLRRYSPILYGTVVLPGTTSIGTTTALELGYVHGVTSSIQTQLDAKIADGDFASQGIMLRGASSGTYSILTDNSANWNTAYSSRIATFTTTGTSGASTWSSNTLNIPNYTLAGLGGVAIADTSGMLSKYARKQSPTFTGTVSGITATMVGLGNVTNNAQWYASNHPTTIAGYGITDAILVDDDFASQGIMLRGASAGTYSILTDNSTNWNTAYSSRISTFTTTGTSGASTWSSNTLNIPNYTLAGLGGVAITDTASMLSHILHRYSPALYGTATALNISATGTISSPAIKPTNLTSSYYPKYNGTSLVNSLTSDNGTTVTINGAAQVNNNLYVVSPSLKSVFNGNVDVGWVFTITGDQYSTAPKNLLLSDYNSIDDNYSSLSTQNGYFHIKSYSTNPIVLNNGGGAVYVNSTTDPGTGNKFAVTGNGYFTGTLAASSFIGNATSATSVTGYAVTNSATQTVSGKKGTAYARYNVANDGGTIGAHVCSTTSTIPDNAIITSGVVNATTAFVGSTGATVSIGTTAGSSATSILVATGYATLSLDKLLSTSCSYVAPFKMTSAGNINVTIAGAIMAVGVLEVWIEYYVAAN